jgi:hypothetical protein
MLTHQDIQDMLQEFKLVKMEKDLMLDKEITRLRKTKQQQSQDSQIAMDQTAQRVLTALQEKHFQCAQVIRNQQDKKVLQQHAESCQIAQLIAHSSHQNATVLDKWRALPNKMIAAHQAPEIEIPKLKKIKLQPSQDSQIAMDQMDHQKSIA